jgi:ADP-dependent NAD(P)H-hydrate dehydratase / NAD(P)H-hydrate epimerase
LIKLIRGHALAPPVEDYITPEAMRDLERRASGYGVSVSQLMENAGRGVAEAVLERLRPRRVCVICGAGNNGGDGLVAARYLSKGCEVWVVLLTNPEGIRTEESRRNWAALVNTGVRTCVAATSGALRGCFEAIAKADVVVAALFGTGVEGGKVREPYATAIEMVNRSKATKVAVDLPSGIDPATGSPSSPCIMADLTVALHRRKVGLRGREEYTGEVVVVPIGIREGVGG